MSQWITMGIILVFFLAGPLAACTSRYEFEFNVLQPKPVVVPAYPSPVVIK